MSKTMFILNVIVAAIAVGMLLQEVIK